VLSSSFVYSAEKQNITLSKEAIDVQAALNQSEADIDELITAGFSITRYNDTLGIAQQTYEAQVALEKTGGKTDFSIVYQKIDELKTIKSSAFIAADEIKALESTVEQTQASDMAPILDLYNQSREAFNSERYEESLKLIEKTYEKISEMEAFDTKLKAFSDAVSKGVINFIKKNWKIISIIIIVIALISILTYDKIRIYLLKNKIKNMEIRKDSIRNLVAQTQKDYFETGKLAETTYKTRTTKYAELIRDINRQIPLLKEELELHELKIKRKMQNKDSKKR
jgi:hypothetical protein